MTAAADTAHEVLVLNPNSTAWMTDRVAADLGQRLAAKGVNKAVTQAVSHAEAQTQTQTQTLRLPVMQTVLRTCTATTGPVVIDSPSSFQAGARGVVVACRQALQDHPRIKTVLLACFGDPGLEELRLAFPHLQVLGLADAAMARAKEQHGRFAVLTCGPAWVAMLTARAAALGHAQHLVGVWALPVNGRLLALEPERWRAALQCAADAARDQGAQALILGGAAFAGLPALFYSDLPQVDALQAVADQMTTVVTYFFKVMLAN